MTIFGDIYQKLLIFQLNDIWRYLTIIWWYLTTETFTLKPEYYRPKDIVIYRLVGTELYYPKHTHCKDTFLKSEIKTYKYIHIYIYTYTYIYIRYSIKNIHFSTFRHVCLYQDSIYIQFTIIFVLFFMLQLKIICVTILMGETFYR